MYLRRLALATLAVAALALAPLVITAPAHASAPCDYDNKVYCDGGDEPGYQWDTIDDFACVQIPGAYLDANDKPVYTGVVGKVYYKDVLVWDSTPAPAPKPSTKPKPKPKPTSSGSTASAPKPSSKPADKPKPSATPTPTPTPSAVAEDPADAATQTGELTIAGEARAGSTITITGTGFAGSLDDVAIELHSTPVVPLGTVATDAAGAFTIEVTIPDEVPAGNHTLVVLVNGVEVATSPVSVVGSDGDQLASLLLLGGLAAAAAAALLVYSLRRRRRTPIPSTD